MCSNGDSLSFKPRLNPPGYTNYPYIPRKESPKTHIYFKRKEGCRCFIGQPLDSALDRVKWSLFCVCYCISSSFLFVHWSVICVNFSYDLVSSIIQRKTFSPVNTCITSQSSTYFSKHAAFLTIKVHFPVSVEVDVCQNFFQFSLLQFLPKQRLCRLLQLLIGDPSITVTVKLREAQR